MMMMILGFRDNACLRRRRQRRHIMISLPAINIYNTEPQEEEAAEESNLLLEMESRLTLLWDLQQQSYQLTELRGRKEAKVLLFLRPFRRQTYCSSSSPLPLASSSSQSSIPRETDSFISAEQRQQQQRHRGNISRSIERSRKVDSIRSISGWKRS